MGWSKSGTCGQAKWFKSSKVMLVMSTQSGECYSNICPSLGPVGLLPTLLRVWVSICLLSLSVDLWVSICRLALCRWRHGVAIWQINRYDHAKPWRGDSMADCQAMQSISVSWHSDLVSDTEIARHDLWSPYQPQVRLESNQFGASFRKARRGPQTKPLVCLFSFPEFSWLYLFLVFTCTMIPLRMSLC